MDFLIEFHKVWALTKRDIYDWSTYRGQVITSLLTAMVGIASWGFNATYRNRSVPEYGTDYVSFLIVGILVANLIMPLSRGMERRLNPWTLETILMSGLRTPTFVLGTVMWNYILSILFFIPQMALGVFFFGAKLNINLPSLTIAIIISSLIVFSLAMISAGMRMVTKVTDPVSWSLAVGQQLLAGMTFPVQHLNTYVAGLSNISWLLPQTWIYHIVRLSALANGSLLQPDVAFGFLVALLISLILLPLGVQTFRWGLRRAKRDGTLGWY